MNQDRVDPSSQQNSFEPMVLPVSTCPSCGTSVRVDSETSPFRCTHCSADIVLDARLIASVRVYRTGIAKAWADELEARRGEMLNRAAARSNPTALRWLMPFVLTVPFWLIAFASGLASTLHPISAGLLVALTIGSFARMTFAVLASVRAPTVTQVLASGMGACATCGGPVTIHEGDAAPRCRYCGAHSHTPGSIQHAFLSGALSRAGIALRAEESAGAENWRTASDAGAVFGVGGRASAATSMAAIIVIGATAMTGWLVVSLVTTTRETVRYPTLWILPTIAVGLTVVVVRAVRVTREAIRARQDFEARIGRALRMPKTGPSPNRAS